MKKVFSILAVALLVSSSLNALTLFNSSILDDSSVDCFTSADRQATRIGFVQELTHAEEHAVFLVLYDECESQQNPEFQQ